MTIAFINVLKRKKYVSEEVNLRDPATCLHRETHVI